MKITRIECQRGGELFPKSLPNGDRFDSTFDLYVGSHLFKEFRFINTDPTVSYVGKSGILAEGVYRFICARRRSNGKKILVIYHATPDRDKNIVTLDDLTDEDLLLDSLVMNVNHGNRYEISDVLVHPRALNWDGSLGCFTFFEDFDKFIDLFELGDKGDFIVTRADGWDAPDQYKKHGG